MNRSADISDDGLYRFRLDRWWGDGPRVVWIMLNPSTADAEMDDPTIRRCIAFTKAWGYDGLTVINRWPLRATNPDDLLPWFEMMAPITRSTGSPVWDYHLATEREVLRDAPLVIAAWGAWPVKRDGDVYGVRFWASKSPGIKVLGLTKQGAPRHPLYVKGDTTPIPWAPEGGE